MRQREIAEAALKIIGEQGLARFKTAAIAREVGLTEGALFRHFPSKEAIVEAVIDLVEERFATGPVPAQGDPLTQLGMFMRARVAMLRQDPFMVRLVFNDQLAQAAEGARERIARLKRRAQGFIRDRLRAAADQGLLVDGISLDAVQVLVHGIALGATFAVDPADPGDPGARAEKAWAELEKLIRR